MRVFLRILLLAVSVLIFISCQKERDLINDSSAASSFIGNTESSDVKTAITAEGDHYVMNWQNGDEIMISSSSIDGGYTFTTTSTTTSGTFTGTTCDGFVSDGNTYTAVYPANIVTQMNGSVRVCLPKVQKYASTGCIEGYPMYAQSNSTTLDFKKLCGILKITLGSTSDLTIKQIDLYNSSKSLSGEFSVDYNNGEPKLDTVGSTISGVTLDCGNSGVSLESNSTVGAYTKDFFIYLPWVESTDRYQQLQIAITTMSGHTYSKELDFSTDGGLNIERGKFTSIKVKVEGGSTELIAGQLPNNSTSTGTLSSKIRYATEHVVFEYGCNADDSHVETTSVSDTARSNHIVITAATSTTAAIYGTYDANTNTTYISTIAPAMKIDNCTQMFAGKKKLKSVDFGNGLILDETVSVNLTKMFQNCESLESIDFSRFNMRAGGSISLESMFEGCSSLQSVDLSPIFVVRVTTTSVKKMFKDAKNLETIVLGSNISMYQNGNVTEIFSETGVPTAGSTHQCSVFCTTDFRYQVENSTTGGATYSNINWQTY